MNNKTLCATSRRRLLGAGLALGGVALSGCATLGNQASSKPIGRVVVVGGGYGGSTAARYLKMWGGNIDVTMVERDPTFISCPISNLVLGGYKKIADVSRGYGGLSAMGVKVVQGNVTAVDPVAKKVRLANGSELSYDRLVLSPGIDFMTDQIPGLQAALDNGRILHSWKAGAQTVGRHARWRRVRPFHSGGALPLSARALRARLHGGQLLQAGQAEVESAHP